MRQGEVFWAGVIEPSGSAPGYDRPYLIVQNDAFNRSRINTVVVCSLTSNLRRAGDPGNVLLVPGEADLPEQSVVNVSQILTIDKSQLRERIGTLSDERTREVLQGINLLLEPRG
ncbi:MAG: type II toxin-antitoxin system PemK/MazF family toxin [Rubrobacteraceae bacterium]|nr:type II toxin-antitoxin system PemK/MazF family toxin [Rubrobacteraceae bacterium]